MHEITVPVEGNRRYLEGPQLLMLHLHSSGAYGTIWVDNVEIEVTPPEQRKKEETAKNLINNSSFESGLYGWLPLFEYGVFTDNPAHEPATAVIDATTAAEGSSSLKIHLPESMGTKHHPCEMIGTPDFPYELGEKITVSFWAKADGARRISANIGPYNGSVSAGLTTEWKRCQGTITVARKYLLEARLIVIFQDAGTYWLDGVQVERGDLTDYEPSGQIEVGATLNEQYPIYAKSATHNAQISVSSRLAKDAQCQLKYTFLDSRDREVGKGEKTVSVPAGKRAELSLPLLTSLYGAFRLKLNVQEPVSNATAATDVTYAVTPDPRDIGAEQSWFGMDNQPIVRHWGGTLRLPGGTLDDMFKAARKAGIRWERSFTIGAWEMHEPEQGKWQWFDGYVNAARRNGIKLMPVLGNSLYKNGNAMPKWAWSDRKAPTLPWYGGAEVYYPKIELWKNFVREYIKHYGDRIDAYEILNESGGFDPEPYVELVKASFEVARATDKRARIMAPATPGQIPLSMSEDSWHNANAVPTCTPCAPRSSALRSCAGSAYPPASQKGSPSRLIFASSTSSFGPYTGSPVSPSSSRPRGGAL